MLTDDQVNEMERRAKSDAYGINHRRKVRLMKIKTKKQAARNDIEEALIRISRMGSTAAVDTVLAFVASTADTDPEVAHGIRDRLYEAVLEYLSDDSRSDSDLVRRVLRVREIRLRWEACG